MDRPLCQIKLNARIFSVPILDRLTDPAVGRAVAALSAPGFRSHPELYDVLKIGGIPVPGVWDCKEIGRQLKVKQPKGSGDDGGEPRVTGLEVTRGTITIELHTDDDEARWEVLRAKIFPLDRPTQRNIQPVDHPQFARHGIRQILVNHASEGRPRGGDPIPARIDWTIANKKSGKTAKPKTVSPSGKLQTPGNALIGQDQNRLQSVFIPVPPSSQLASMPDEQFQSLPPALQVLGSDPR